MDQAHYFTELYQFAMFCIGAMTANLVFSGW